MRVHLSQIEKTLPLIARRYPELFEPSAAIAEAALPPEPPRRGDGLAIGAAGPQRRSDKPAALAPARRTPA